MPRIQCPRTSRSARPSGPPGKFEFEHSGTPQTAENRCGAAASARGRPRASSSELCARTSRVQRLGVIRKEVRSNVGTDVAGAPGQEDGHDFRVSGRCCRSCACRSGGARFGARRERHAPPRASFHVDGPRSERIAPLAQRRNVDIDPVVPPIKRASVVAEGFGKLLRRQGGTERFRCLPPQTRDRFPV